MKFMLAMYNDEAAWSRLSKSEQDAAVEKLFAFDKELQAAGILRASHGLHMSNEGVSIRRRPDGGKSVNDGPFAESKEVLGGFNIIECASKAEAVEWAKKLPLATWGVEVRQLQDFQ